MEIVGFTLVFAGALVALVYGITLLVRAFQTSVLWGLGYIFIPFVSLVFVIKYWDISKDPFLKSLGGTAVMILGMLFMPEGTWQQA